MAKIKVNKVIINLIKADLVFFAAFGLGVGITGALGGILVSQFGFDLVFIIVGILAFLGGLIPLLIYKNIVPKGNHYKRIPETKRRPLS